MSAPSSDRAAIRQTVRALKASGHTLKRVWDGEEFVPVSNERDAIEAIMATDESTLYVGNDWVNEWVMFILGNEPFEVVADYSMSLESIIEPLFDRWEA
jgi:hypothetical protein